MARAPFKTLNKIDRATNISIKDCKAWAPISGALTDEIKSLKQAPRNHIIILTAPSGAGKTSITRYLLERFSSLLFSISATTRPARENEVDGRDYYFLSPEKFQQKIQENAFVEWEMVYEGKYYGTLKVNCIAFGR
jgi:hypothetical protein